jgi:tetraacyldisaccharide 4'-kinase
MQILRKLLWPFSLIYGFIAFLRNKCYDLDIFDTFLIPNKSICVGNLSVGGTGKTPHVAFLAEYLFQKKETAILSRGYGRKTQGFINVNEKSSAEQVGDEPLFYFTHFKNKVHVAVCEKRKIGVLELYKLFPSNELIILDDAFQHRAVKAGLSILLTDFNTPFSSDLVLPAGNLREWRLGKKRADCVIVTKCPSELTELEKKTVAINLGVQREKVYFSTIEYGELIPLQLQVEDPKSVLLITGIANPKPLIRHLKSKYAVEHLQYDDHHAFTKEEIDKIHQKFDTFASGEKIILTTEKDFMRLKDFKTEWNLNAYPWYYQPITVKIDNEKQFKTLIDQYVNTI